MILIILEDTYKENFAGMSHVEITRIDNFICPACGENMRQVSARDGIVKGWCPTAKKEINVKIALNDTKKETKKVEVEKPVTYLDTLKQKRAKILKEVVSAREDGDLKENSPYHAAREQLSILDDKILKEENRLKQENQ
jgi:hypothetical protein